MSHRAHNGLAARLFVVALVLRVGWVLVGGRDALASSDDAKGYHDLAVNLVERHQFATSMDPPHRLDIPYATRPPLTPFALASVYLIFGPHLLAGQLLLACLGAMSVVALYLLGRQLFSEQVGLVAAVIAVGYPFFVFLSAVPLTENLAILLYILLAMLLTADGAKHNSRHAVLTGGVLGFSALDRPQILGFFPLLVLLAFANAKVPMAKRMLWLCVALVCSAAVVTPWMIRNRLAIGAWFPVTLQGGAALYMGNNPYTQTPLTKLQEGARGWNDDPRWGSELAGLTPLEADRKAFLLATVFIRQHPGQSFNYSMQKVGLFFSAYNHAIARVSWYPVFALSLLGLFWTARQWRKLLPLHLLILQTILTAAIFTSMPRFRAPVEPFFVLMAAYALHEIRKRYAALRSRE